MEFKKSILLIDDDRGMHDLCYLVLKRAGYRCCSAFDGEEGLQKILELNPDLILLDLMMPKVDGVQLYRELISKKEYAAHRDIPVIVLTAKADDNLMRSKMLEMGVSAYLTKPFGSNELLNVIDNVFITHEIKLRNKRLQEEVSRTKEYLERIVDNAPVGIFSTDRQGQIVKVNPSLIRMFEGDGPEDFLGLNILEKPIFNGVDLTAEFQQVLNQGKSFEVKALDHSTPCGRRLKINLKTVPLRDNEGQVIGLISLLEDITEAEKRAYGLSILGQIGQAMQGALELDKLLHLILTAVTAGCALGFSRAMIFLINREREVLEGRMGVGPANQEDALRIWSTLARDQVDLEAFLKKYGMTPPAEKSPFDLKVRKMTIPMSRDRDVVVRTVNEKKTFKVDNAPQDPRVSREFIDIFEMEEFVTVPLIAKDKVIGVVIADNKYSGQPIEEEKIELLTLFANQAGLAIESAEAYKKLELKMEMLSEAYQKLREAQDRLVRSERLATIGEMAAHVAHEIRNPLVIIGGFARSILKAPHKVEENITSARIIVEEVSRLEKILANVLDFAKITKPVKQPVNINKIIDETCFLIKDNLKDRNIVLSKELHPELPLVLADPQQIKQALLNVLQNAIYSMPQGGKLLVKTEQNKERLLIEIKDTGKGIPPDILENMFNPFFTTRPGGTGLGLAVTQKIIEDHEGKIEVESQVGQGTTFRFTLPIEEGE